MFEVQVSECSADICRERCHLLVLALYSALGIHHGPEQKDAKLGGAVVGYGAAVLTFLPCTCKF